MLKRFPFTIVLKGAIEKPKLEPLRIKLDPGSHMTGLALVNDATGELRFVCSKTAKAGEEQQRDGCPVDN